MNHIMATILASVTSIAMTLTTSPEAWSMSNGLTGKQQGIVSISAFTANGDLEKLKIALNEGLDAGLTVNEVKEVLVQLYAYAGFPRSLNSIGVFMEVMNERQAKGIKDEQGKEAGSLPADKTRLQLGTEIQTKLAGAPVQGPMYEFVPAIDAFLKDHLFGDIFGRDNLDFQSRELATISALAAMNGVNLQLRSHFNIGMNTGLTEMQLRGLIEVLGAKAGASVAGNATSVLEAVIASR